MIHTSSTSVEMPNGIMKKLLSLSDNVKLRIISMLTESMIHSDSKESKSKEHTDEMLKKYGGSWSGNDSVDELMKKVRDKSTSSEPLKF